MTVSNGLERTLKIAVVACDWRNWWKPRTCQDSQCPGRVSKRVLLEWSQKSYFLNELFRVASSFYTSYPINIRWRLLTKRFHHVFFYGRRLCSVSWLRHFPQHSILNNMWRIRTDQELQKMQKHLDIIANTKNKK